MPKLVSVTLLNWNGLKFLSGCIDSVLAQTYPSIELIVVDNASSDDSVRWLTERYGNKINLIVNSANIGFSRGMNVGIKAAAGDYIMPLNFDVIMDNGFVAAMVDAIESGERVGSVSGKLLRLGDEGKTHVIDSTGHQIFKNRYVTNRGEDQQDKGQYDTGDLVFGTCGAVPLYSREMLNDIAYGGEYYDESFFIMLEDVDVDWRAQLRGWNCVYTPLAAAYHYRGATGSGKSRLIQRHYYKNRYLLMLKNDFALSYLKYLPAIALMDLYLNLDILFTSPIGLIQAWGDLIRLLPLTLRKRRQIKTARIASRADIEAWFRPYPWMSDVKRKLGL
jgi:GT2 family glycosyltransferase